MKYALHWGEELNLSPLVGLTVATIAVLFTRFLTVWFFRRRVGSKIGVSDAANADFLKKVISADGQVVPRLVSAFYLLSGCGLIATTLCA